MRRLGRSLRLYQSCSQALSRGIIPSPLDEEGIWLDSSTCASLLRWCGDEKVLPDGKHVHYHIIKSRLDGNLFLGNLLVQMYSKCGALEDARDLLDKMHPPDKFSWNFMTRAYARFGNCKEALQLFNRMQCEGVFPDKFILVSILSACSSPAEGKRTHACILSLGFQSDVVVGTSLVNMYGRCGSWEDARRTFDELPERNAVSWKILLGYCIQNKQGSEALQLFEQMLLEGMIADKYITICILSAFGSQAILADCKRIHSRIVSFQLESDVHVGTALVHMYGLCNRPDDAWKVFAQIPERDVVLWNAMIAVDVIHGIHNSASQLYRQMQQEGMMADKVTFIAMLDACASQTNMAEGILMHACIVGIELEFDIVVGTALINMYGKCGCVGNARKIFEKLPVHNTLSWTAIIAVCSQHGQEKDAFQLFEEMQHLEVQADEVTLLSILYACSQTGLVDEGCQCFSSMIWYHGIGPTVDHFNCMIDLFGRAGRLDEAEDLIRNMAFEPNALSWMTLLSACRNGIDAERGEYAANIVFELDPDNTASHVILANIYAAAGRLNDAMDVMNRMRRKY